MNRSLPWLVLVAALGAVGAVVVFARKPAPLPLPPKKAAWTGDVDRLREIRRERPSIPAGGMGHPDYGKRLDRVRAADPAGLEVVVLDPREDRLLRVDLLNAMAAQPGDAVRRLSGAIAGNPEEATALRLAALSILMTYRDPHTFDLLRGLWESRRPFEGRALLCTALGECGQPGAIPLLREALGTLESSDIRAHAALALGAFVEEGAVRADLIRLAKEDDVVAVRENALRALARSAAGDVDESLKGIVEDPALRRLAEELLKERATSSPRGRVERKGR